MSKMDSTMFSEVVMPGPEVGSLNEGAQTRDVRPTVGAPLERVLTFEQVKAWQEKGFCIVNPRGAEGVTSGWLFSSQESQKFRCAARTAVLGNGVNVAALPDLKNFGGIGFPFLGRDSEPLNDLVLHPRVIQAARELLNMPTSSVPLISQAECWVKRDAPPSLSLPQEFVNTDQRMHCDYPNHYLTHPPPWSTPEAVAMIVYLDDEDECGGGTACVPREGDNDPAYQYPYLFMPGVGNLPWINDRESAELYLEQEAPEAYAFRKKLYERELRVRYKIGTTLIYRLDLWHRGTPLKTNKDRAVVNILYKKPEARHITSWHRGWATNSYNTWSNPRIYPPQVGLFEDLLSSLSAEQRTLWVFRPSALNSGPQLPFGLFRCDTRGWICHRTPSQPKQGSEREPSFRTH